MADLQFFKVDGDWIRLDQVQAVIRTNGGQTRIRFTNGQHLDVNNTSLTPDRVMTLLGTVPTRDN